MRVKPTWRNVCVLVTPSTSSGDACLLSVTPPAVRLLRPRARLTGWRSPARCRSCSASCYCSSSHGSGPRAAPSPTPRPCAPWRLTVAATEDTGPLPSCRRARRTLRAPPIALHPLHHQNLPTRPSPTPARTLGTRRRCDGGHAFVRRSAWRLPIPFARRSTTALPIRWSYSHNDCSADAAADTPPTAQGRGRSTRPLVTDREPLPQLLQSSTRSAPRASAAARP